MIKYNSIELEKNILKQHEKGKLHAIERINLLFDKDSFQEAELKEDYDGVIIGFGKVNGKRVYVYAQDFTYIGGTLGEQHGEKIVYIIGLAIKKRAPIIGIIDSGGARIQKGVKALARYGDIFWMNTYASGYIPQFSVIAGPCAGGAVYSPGITDFIFMVDKIGSMFVTGPKVIKSVTNEETTLEELGGSVVHSSISGVVHERFDTEYECFRTIRQLLSMIPHYYGDKSYKNKRYSLISKAQASLLKVIPEDYNKTYDMKNVLNIILDDNSFIELQPDYAKNIIIGFGKLGSITIGIIANQTSYLAGALDCDSSNKAARFITYCDCYDIPLVTFTDVPGFLPGKDQEKKGIIKHGAKLLYAYSQATTIKINVILRKAYGGAYIAMSSKHLKADRVFAWPRAEIAVMGAEGAVEILYAKELLQIEEDKKKEFYDSKIQEYKNIYMNINMALSKGYVDKIIKPEESREEIFRNLLSLIKKRRSYNIKKHGNIPL